MTDRSATLASGSGVVVAMVGTALQSVLLSILGPAIAFAIHMLTEYRASKNKQADESLLEHLKLDNFRLRCDLATANARITELTKAQP